MQPPSSTCLPSLPIAMLHPTRQSAKTLPLRDINPTSPPWQIVSSVSMQSILDVGCIMNLTGTPTGSGLSNVPRGMMCNGVQVLRGRSWLSPSENVGQRHQHASTKKPTHSLLLLAMESTGTNQRAKHLATLTSRTLVLLMPVRLILPRHHLGNANRPHQLLQRHDVSVWRLL